jgi:TolB-like protein
MRMNLSCILGALLLAGTVLAEPGELRSPDTAAAEPLRVAVLPFVNLSGAERAPAEISTGFERRLAARGYSVVAGPEVEAFLAADRVRYLDSLAGQVRQDLMTKLSASAVVYGTVYTFVEEQNAIVGISARMLRRDGSLAWAGVAGLSSEDTEGALGLHRIASVSRLAEKALDRLVRDLPAAGSTAGLAAARARPLDVPPPLTFRSPALEPGRAHTVCVLPLENRTSARLAARAVAELLALRLAASQSFTVVEQGDLRAALPVSGVHGLRTGDPAELQKLSNAVGTSLFLRGTVYVFKDSASGNSAVTPELELDLALTDAAAGRILWTSRIARRGRDYEGLLEQGAITNIVTLTDQAVAEMIRAAEKAKPASPAGAAIKVAP